VFRRLRRAGQGFVVSGGAKVPLTGDGDVGGVLVGRREGWRMVTRAIIMAGMMREMTTRTREEIWSGLLGKEIFKSSSEKGRW